MSVEHQNDFHYKNVKEPQKKFKELCSRCKCLSSKEKLNVIGIKMFEYGIASNKLAKFGYALKYFEIALNARKFQYGPGHEFVMETHLQMGHTLKHLGKDTQAAYHFLAAKQKGHELHETSNGKGKKKSRKSSMSKARIRQQAGDTEVTSSAIDLCLKGVEKSHKASELISDMNCMEESKSADDKLKITVDISCIEGSISQLDVNDERYRVTSMDLAFFKLRYSNVCSSFEKKLRSRKYLCENSAQTSIASSRFKQNIKTKNQFYKKEIVQTQSFSMVKNMTEESSCLSLPTIDNISVSDGNDLVTISHHLRKKDCESQEPNCLL